MIAALRVPAAPSDQKLQTPLRKALTAREDTSQFRVTICTAAWHKSLECLQICLYFSLWLRLLQLMLRLAKVFTLEKGCRELARSLLSRRVV
jgi:hypothetical protein